MLQSSNTNSPSANSDLFPDASKPSTPAAQTIPAYLSDLSPPDSQGGVPLAAAAATTTSTASTSVPAVAPSASGANVNGKRPISSIDATGESLAGASANALALGNAAAAATIASASASGASGGPSSSRLADTPQGSVKMHGPSGYSWVRPEDEPGYAWRNKKTMDEYTRTWEAMVDKDRTVGSECCSVL